MAGLRDELDLDVSAALRRIDTVEAALGRAAKSFRVDLAHALDVLRKADTTVTLKADAGDITRSVNRAVDAADTEVSVTADTKAATAGVHRLGEETDHAADEADRLKKNMSGAASIGSAFAAGFVLRRVVSELTATVNAASDLNESLSKTQQVFKGSAPEIESWAKTASTSVLLSQQAALEAASTFGNLFTSLGLARQAAASLSPEVVQLAADIASFNNIGVDEATEKLRAGLVGEVEPLRTVGIALNSAGVEAKAMALGLADANGVVSEGAKVQARWALILEQSKNAQGDVARTADGYANTQRRVNAEIANARVEIGQGLIPVARILQRDILGVLDAFTALPGPVKAVLIALAGLTVAGTAIAVVSAALQTLSTRLEGVAISGPLAAAGIRTLGVALSSLAIIGVIVTGVQLLTAALGKTRESVDDLARSTDKELLNDFKDLQRTISQLAGPSGFSDMAGSADFYAEVQRELNKELGHFADVARTNLDVARRVRDVLKEQGTDVSRLDKVIQDEEAAQARANETTGKSAAAMGDASDAAGKLATKTNEIAEAINRLIDPNLNLIKAQIEFRDSISDVASAMAEGRRKGESYQQFQDRLRLTTLDVVKAAEEYVFKQAEAGKISLEAGAIQQALRATLLGVADTFPTLRGEIATYITSLTSAATATTRVIGGIGSAVADIQKFRTNPAGIAEAAAQQKIAADLAAALQGAKSAGTAAGHAAATAAVEEVEKTLRVSAQPGQGLDLGGFIVKGIDVGAATNGEKAKNAVLRLIAGMRNVVDTAAKIDPAERLGILEAVAAVDKATRDLAETRKKFPGKTIEVAIAEGKLRDAQGEVNKKLAEAVSASKAVAEAQARQKTETDRLKDANDKLSASVKAGRDALRNGLDAYNQAITAVRTLNREQQALRDAQRTQAELQKRQAELPGEIAAAQAKLTKAQSDAAAVTSEESLQIVQARRAEADAEKNLDVLRAGSTSTVDQLVELTLRLRDAEDSLAAAKDNEAGRTADVIAAERELAEARRTLVPAIILQAEGKLADAKAKAAAQDTKFKLATIDATKARDAAEKTLRDAQAGSTASAEDLEEATLQVAVARDRLNEAIAASVAPTAAVSDAEQNLKDLQAEQKETTDRLADATTALEDAQLALVESQRRLIEGGEDLIGITPKVRDFFLEIAKQAGLTGKPLQDLITLLDTAIEKSRTAFEKSPLGQVQPFVPADGSVPPGAQPTGDFFGGAPLFTVPGKPDTFTVPGGPDLQFRTPAPQQPVVAPNIDAELQRLANQNPNNVIWGPNGRVMPTVEVNIFPKTAVYDPQQTVQTLSTLEWLFQ